MLEEYVYCITNPLIPNVSKCGGTSRYPTNRCKELSNTSLPLECNLEYFIKVNNWKNAEKYIHNKLVENGFKKYNKREWFECNPGEIKYIFDECEKIYKSETKIVDNKKIVNNPIKNYTNKYSCDICNYKTDVRTAIYNHNKTKKHISNMEKHEKKTKDEINTLKLKNQEIEELKQELIKIKQEKDKEIEMAKLELEAKIYKELS